MMNYGRDYGNRNFLDRAANTVRGWLGHRGGHSGYDDGYRGGMYRGRDEGHGGYREMGDVSGGYRGWQGGMDHGYGATNWTGRNPDWDRGTGGGWGSGGNQEYRTGGYQPRHGSWDVDWDDADRTMPRGGMSRGMMGSGGGRYDRGYRDDMDRGMNRGMSGGMMGRGMQGGMNRGYDRDDYRQGGGMQSGGMGYGTGMLGEVDMGDASGGMLGNYGAYSNYGIERFRTGNNGGVPTGQYWTGYGHGSGYR
jgi:hypothetical protein